MKAEFERRKPIDNCLRNDEWTAVKEQEETVYGNY